MSMFRKQQTQFNDAKVLCEALGNLGYKNVESHAEPQALTGSPIPGGDNKAEIIVRKASNPTLYGDLGFKKQSDGTYAMCARMYVEVKSGKYTRPDDWVKPLNKEYGVTKVKRIIKKNNWTVLKTKDEGGKIQMQIKVGG